ncbi:DNA recombination protein RmuC [Lysobacter korlensis]|uniref:DNA recombination protein RmuC n=1 Tax=Lysobacter korlensis TaxID=553636 RepID=A0ABV6RHF0_9GAMM
MNPIPPVAGYAILALAAFALLFVGYALMRLQRRPTDADARLQALTAERDRLAAELEQARSRAREDGEALGALRAAADAHAQLADEHAELRARLETARAALEAERVARASASAELNDRSVQLERLRAQFDEQSGAYARLQSEHSQASAHLTHAEKARAQMQQFVDEAQARLSDAFAQLAGKAFEERGAVFEKNIRHATVQSKADIETLLKPFAEQLGEFRQRVDTLYGEEAKERATLVGALGELRTLNQDMAAQAAALTKALRGNAKVRGDWGELMLESVLRGSGLEDGVHYERQKQVTGEDGRGHRPDIVVRLPGDRCIVVDSKVNLVAWEQAMNADDIDAHHEAMHRHAVALRQHVRELADKQYPKLFGEAALDVTVAFIPIEGALSGALGTDGSLQTYAFERRIVFASPNTLMALLRVVDGLWTRERIQKQAEEINKAGGLLLDALTSFLEDFEKIGARLRAADETFSAAKRRLVDSKMAVIPRAKRLVSLGVKPNKGKLPELLAPDADTEIEAVGQTLLKQVTEATPGERAKKE